MTKKHNKYKSIIDTSGAEDFQKKMHRENQRKLATLRDKLALTTGLSMGTSKGINSILTKAENKGKVAKATSTKIEEELTLKRIAKQKLRSSKKS